VEESFWQAFSIVLLATCKFRPFWFPFRLLTAELCDVRGRAFFFFLFSFSFSFSFTFFVLLLLGGVHGMGI